MTSLSPGQRLARRIPPCFLSSQSQEQANRLVLVGDGRPSPARPLLEGPAKSFAVEHHAGIEALAERCRQRTPAAVVLPLDWPSESDANDSPLLRFIREHRHRFPIFVYADTARLPIGVYCRALRAGARRVFNESLPEFATDLGRTLEQLIEESGRRLAERQQLQEIFESCGLFGRSPLLGDVFRRAVRAGHFTDLPVLLLGETGTGKQRLAEAIHRLDARRQGHKFLTINCSAISKTLAESELFGHVKGAFSGAGSERDGLFRAADGGTLFLDEIGELDWELQPKLLRVLQERRLLPVGADLERSVNIRVIAATNRPLDEMVKAGKFRQDLYQRLNVFQIKIPPLRDRRDDIELQARHFLNIYRPDPAVPAPDLTPAVLEALRMLPWEGNTRQLENVIRETVIFKEQGDRIELEDLPAWVLERLAGPMSPVADEPHIQTVPSAPLSETMADHERSLLQSLLAKNRGNRTRTAAELGVTPRTLYNKLKKHRLDDNDGLIGSNPHL